MNSAHYLNKIVSRIQSIAPMNRNFSSLTSARRSLSTHASTSISKLQDVVEDYRSKNYTAELPSRCHKDIIKALKQDDVITVDKLYSFLSTVDASQRISREDVVTIVSELKDDSEKGLVISPKTLLSIF